MKTLNEFVNYKFVSLNDVDEKLASSISNLEGQRINECCGCCCEPCCDDVKCCNSYTYPKYYSENEITCMLSNKPEVQNIFDVHYQFSNRFRFPGESLNEIKEPLYFKKLCTTISASSLSGPVTVINSVNAIMNEKLYNYIKKLVDEFDFTYPIVLESTDQLQLFFIKGEGGYKEEEKTIKKGLEDVAKILGKLDNKDEITWSQVLDVSIYNLDNVYNFLVTCTIDSSKFLMTEEDYKKINKKIESNK